MLPLVDIAYIAEEIRRYSEELTEAFDVQEGDGDVDPRLLASALDDLFQCLRLVEEDAINRFDPIWECEDERVPTGIRERVRDLHSLGDHGIDLVARLAALAERLSLPQTARGIVKFALPLGCWVARNGGELSCIEPVVDGAASLAGELSQVPELAQLSSMLTEIVEAVAPRISQDTSSGEPTRPWRVLLLKRAQVATRSQQPLLMKQAFDSVVEYLPEDAPSFFRETMEQLEAMRCPAPVRALVQDYYERCCGPRFLH